MDTVPLGEIPLGQIPSEKERSRPFTWFDDSNESEVSDPALSSADRYKDLVNFFYQTCNKILRVNMGDIFNTFLPIKEVSNLICNIFLNQCTLKKAI